MIASLTGRLRHRSPEEVVVECAGVGYGLTVPLSTYGHLPEVGSELTLLVYTHVREDALALYGFRLAVEKSLFQRLISVSGIGPKLAIAIMSGVAAEELVQLLQSGDLKRLTMIPGVGKKTAERLVLELRDKLADLAAASLPAAAGRAPVRPRRDGVADDVVSALVNLGYKGAMAEEAVAKAAREGAGDFEKVLREALRLLAPP